MADKERIVEIEERVIKVIATELKDKGIEISQITADADFIKDLGADSLDVVQLIIAMEEEFEMGEIPDEEAENIRTVKDVVDYLLEKLPE